MIVGVQREGTINMARTRDRVIALVIASTFLVSTVGVSAAIVWQVVADGKEDSPATLDDTNNETNNEAKKDMLQGTQLGDFTPVENIEELQTIDLQPGSGDAVKSGDTVTVDYTGAVAATGKIFQSSLDFGQPVSFKLDQVIVGWKEGMVGMKVDGKRRLLIPAVKAYGGTPPEGSGIPADADLVFDVTLRKIGE
jgi:FKBP-type peptidyl-prolyl cis-trans isomerase